ncbi:MAG: hypothetical protein Q8N96_00380 [Methylovulum sp.]|nr:hypothetical protein [Methylovulum sp.]
MDISTGLAQQLALSVNDIELAEGNGSNKNALFTLNLSEALTGGSGIDKLTGGNDDDRFIFAAGDSGVGSGNVPQRWSVAG